MSAQAAAANVGPWPCRVNKELDAAAQSEPQSPVAPAYRLWIADNLAREARYLEAIRVFDTAIDSAQSARRLLPQLDPALCALAHKAQVARISGDATTAISSYKELAALSSDPSEALFQAGCIAETIGDDERAAELYGLVASGNPSPKTDDPAQLARRALQRLESAAVTYLPEVLALADPLGSALESHDLSQLDRLAAARTSRPAR